MTVWRIRLVLPDGVRPALLEADTETPRGAVVTAVGAVGRPTAHLFVDGQRWSVDDTAAIVLDHGATVGPEPVAPDEPPDAIPAGWYVVAVTGPSAGRAAPLPATVGRAPGCDLVVDDPTLSARHFAVDAARTVRDVGSRNGTLCDGRVVPPDGVPLEPGARVHAGASTFAVVELRDDRRAVLHGRAATGPLVQRRFRAAEPDLPVLPPEPRPPSRGGDTGGSGWWRALVPIATAGGMALVTGRWWFLAIAALAPLVYAVDAARRTRRRRRDEAVESARHAAARAAYERAVADARRLEVRRARERYPGGGVAAVLARFGHRRVWERRPGDADFGAVTVGTAEQPSALQRPGQHDAVRLWHAPLLADLVDEGPLAVIGPSHRAGAVARALLTDLCFGHAPGDVRVWVIAPDRSDDWEFARWLPHAFTDDHAHPGGAQVATGHGTRAALVDALRAAIADRRERGVDAGAPRHGRPVLPLHVVVVDGAATLPTADLAALLHDGPPVGVTAIVLDESVVPDGARAELRLGIHADDATYASVRTAAVGAVSAIELTCDVALSAALALAPLHAHRTDDPGVLPERARLAELIDFASRDVDAQLTAWASSSPRTAVPVGVGAGGAPVRLDVVGDGPHGLLGGMTRSGKTEFLKTWIAALALHNHPDDLAIVIVDFKGGVDHQPLTRLPHVVALATNQDIDRFERTLTLLAAELERRQTVFVDQGGVATLEGYRTARTSRADLPAVPRLLVVVDEFAELLATPEGRAQLGRLESIARVGAGLGVHLLLVTQLFDHALPPTIEAQAGLRVCFKVQQPEHSNTVLRSPAAAALAGTARGRGFVRRRDGELVEFQAARVGNASHTTGGPPPAPSILLLTGDHLGAPAAETSHEVPHEHQDLHQVIELVRRAAEVAGATDPVVPWPAELPDALAVGELPDGDHGVVIGVADHPQRQRRVPLALDPGDDVTLLVGAPGAGHHDALVTSAVQLVRAHTPDDLHVYGIDALGHGLAAIADAAHVGAIATRDDATALRILTHLTREVEIRRGGALGRPDIAVLVLGLDRLFLHGEGSVSPLLAPLTTLANEAAGTGVRLICSGSHAMLTNRIGVLAARRLVFRAHDALDYPPTVPRAQRAQLTVPMRCADSASGLVAQIAHPGDAATVAGLVAATTPSGPARRPPERFTRVAWPLPVAAVRLGDVADGALPFGVDPDTGEVVCVDPRDDGVAFRVVGPPKSGRSAALAAIATLAARGGWDVVVAAASRRSPLHGHGPPGGRRATGDELAAIVAEGFAAPTVVLVDDAHRLRDPDTVAALLAAEGGPVVAVLAGPADAFGPAAGPGGWAAVGRALAGTGGVSLMPTRPRDAEAFGVRTLDERWLVQPRPGLGVLALGGEARRLQLPKVEWI